MSCHSVTFTITGKSLVIYNDETKNHVLMKLTEFEELRKLVDDYKFNLFYEQAMAKLKDQLSADKFADLLDKSKEIENNPTKGD